MIGIVAEIPRIYTALAQWGACLMYISLLPLKYKKGKLALISIGFLAVQSSFLELTGNVDIIYWIPCMSISVLLMFGYIYLCTKSSFLDCLYYCMHTFVLAELIASFERQLFWFFWQDGNLENVFKLFFMGVIYSSCLLCIYLLQKKYCPTSVKLSISRKEAFGAFMIGVAVFSISNLGFLSGETNFIGQYPGEIVTVRTLVDLGGYAILFAQYILCYQSRYQKELEAMNNILQNHYLQYEQSKESMEMIGQMYHDLKHQITALRLETNEEIRNHWLDSIQEEIDAYQVQNKTGNAVLDVVLTSKKMQCKKNNISLTCVVDGKLLEKMEARDICNIFGNALDNAIEYVKKVSDVEKRLIHVVVSKKQGFLLICFENYFEGNLLYEEGLPKTTKKDKYLHGYGLKSIKMIAKKYDGQVSIETENHWFELAIILPLL